MCSTWLRRLTQDPDLAMADAQLTRLHRGRLVPQVEADGLAEGIVQLAQRPT
jgi:hypothetical protein